MGMGKGYGSADGFTGTEDADREGLVGRASVSRVY